MKVVSNLITRQGSLCPTEDLRVVSRNVEYFISVTYGVIMIKPPGVQCNVEFVAAFLVAFSI